MRVEIFMANERRRQTYFGALNDETKEFILREYAGASSASTIDFVKYLRERFCGQRMVLIWDGAAYYKAREIKAYLA
jgi:transposase